MIETDVSWCGNGTTAVTGRLINSLQSPWVMKEIVPFDHISSSFPTSSRYRYLLTSNARQRRCHV